MSAVSTMAREWFGNGSVYSRLSLGSNFSRSRSACAPRTPSLFKEKSQLSFPSLASLICLCMLTVGSGNVWGQVSSQAPADGESYVIAVYSGSKYYALPNEAVNGTTISGVEIELNAYNKVSTTAAAGKTWTLEEGTDDNEGQYYFKYTSGGDTYYLYKNGTGKSNVNFKVSTGDKNYWSFATSGTGYIVTAVDRGSNHPNIYLDGTTFKCNNSTSVIRLLPIGDTGGGGGSSCGAPTSPTNGSITRNQT